MDGGSSKRLNVVTIGGGTGSSILLRGLKRYVDRIDITAIVTTFDDGGSSGILRREYGVPALGDLRRCIAVLLPEEHEDTAIDWMLEHRFEQGGSLQNHALGNLMLLAACQRTGDLSSAVDEVTKAFRLLGRAVPVSDEPTTLCAETEKGDVIRGESKIGSWSHSRSPLARVYLDPPVDANRAAIKALNSAHLIVLGPGDLFTSVIPNLLPRRVNEAIAGSGAQILQICNTANASRETEGFAVSDYVRTVNAYLRVSNQSDVKKVGAMIVNQPRPGAGVPEKSVEIDSGIHSEVGNVLARSVADDSNPRVHHANRLAAAVIEYVDTFAD